MKILKRIKNNKSSVLIEILMAISLFGLVCGSISLFAIDAVRNTKLAEQKNQVVETTKEILNAINVNKKDAWSTVSTLTIGNQYFYNFEGNKYSVIPVNNNNVFNGITSYFTVSSVFRDANGNIVNVGGTEDIHSRKVTINASWTDLLGQAKNINQEYYINDWSTKQWFQTTVADFNLAPLPLDKTKVVDVGGGDGSVKLSPVFYSDWCKPSLPEVNKNVNLTRSGIPIAMAAKFGEVDVVTGENASGYTYAKIGLDANFPPNPTEIGMYNSNKGYAVFTDADYAYIGSKNPNHEVEILRLSTAPNYTEYGYYEPSGNGQAVDISVKGNAGFVLIGNKLHSFDLTSKQGQRSGLQIFNLAGTATSLVINGNFAYVTITGVPTKLQIVDITNPSNMTLAASISPSAGNGQASFVNTDGTRLYLATSYSASYPEVFIYNITNKASPISLGTYNLDSSNPISNMNIQAISVPKSTRIVIGGHGGTAGRHNYIVLDSTNENLLTKCGGMEVLTGINDLATVEDVVNKSVYTYALTNDSSAEIKIVRGGEGGGDAEGNGYASTGSYTSVIYDTGGTTPTFYSVDTRGLVPANTSGSLMVRTSANSDMSGATSWVNANGDTSPGSIALNAVTPFTWGTSFNKRYIQYKVTFGSDTISTPQLDSIRISYQL